MTLVYQICISRQFGLVYKRNHPSTLESFLCWRHARITYRYMCMSSQGPLHEDFWSVVVFETNKLAWISPTTRSEIFEKLSSLVLIIQLVFSLSLNDTVNVMNCNLRGILTFSLSCLYCSKFTLLAIEQLRMSHQFGLVYGRSNPSTLGCFLCSRHARLRYVFTGPTPWRFLERGSIWDKQTCMNFVKY